MMSLEQISGLKPLRRSKKVLIPLTAPKQYVTLYEMMAGEFWELKKRSEKNGDLSDAACAGIVIESMTGFTEKPTDEQIEHFCTLYSADNIRMFFNEMIAFDAPETSVEDAAKN